MMLNGQIWRLQFLVIIGKWYDIAWDVMRPSTLRIAYRGKPLVRLGRKAQA